MHISEAEGYRVPVLALISVLPSLAGDEGRVRHDLYCDGSLKEHPVLVARSLRYAVVSFSCWYKAFLYSKNHRHLALMARIASTLG
jgi:hypothetical protein